jgi:EmrB/QacA subfamily drug resistance transporter
MIQQLNDSRHVASLAEPFSRKTILETDPMPSPPSLPDPRRWWILALVSLAQVMVVLDVTIVNVALPSIQDDLGFSADNLQWVVNAYLLLFGGFLLLGGRLADLLGRRRVLLSGLGLFAAASLAGGLANSSGLLIAARAVQGLGGALLSPSALAIVTVTFPHGRERNTALGIWGALAGLGGTLGVILGGVLVDGLGWEAIFFVNVPIALLVILAAPRIVPETRAEGAGRGFDLLGAILGTTGVMALVFGVIRTGPLGWGAAEVLGSFAAALALLTAFVTHERRVAAPLVPLRVFGSRGLRAAGAGLSLNGSGFLAMFFLSALFLQDVRGDDALAAGLHFLPMGVTAVLGAGLASRLVTTIGTRPVLVAGALISAAGLALLTTADATGAYATHLLPGFAVFGFGISMVGVPYQVVAVADVRHEDAGAAGGVVSAAFQIGGALGLAVISTLTNAHVTHLAQTGDSPAAALTGGYHLGLTIAAGLAVANALLAALGSPALRPSEAELLEAAPA